MLHHGAAIAYEDFEFRGALILGPENNPLWTLTKIQSPKVTSFRTPFQEFNGTFLRLAPVQGGPKTEAVILVGSLHRSVLMLWFLGCSFFGLLSLLGRPLEAFSASGL